MLKAIETAYKGYRFRSRLEARWAVFFDVLGIPYEYEREGYDLDGMRYLPDFWLPEQRCFYEVKGEMPVGNEFEKIERLAKASGFPIYMAVGEIKPFQWEDLQYINIMGFRPRSFFPAHIKFGREIDGPKFGPDEIVAAEHGWCECPYCGAFDLAFDFTAENLPCGCVKKRVENNPLFKGIKDEDFSTLEDEDSWFISKLYGLLHTGNSPRIEKAIKAARQARFEFGEKGRRA